MDDDDDDCNKSKQFRNRFQASATILGGTIPVVPHMVVDDNNRCGWGAKSRAVHLVASRGVAEFVR